MRKNGFTFIELLLIIALVLALAIPATMFAGNFLDRVYAGDAIQGLRGALVEARSQAMAGKKNSSWGVKLNDARFVVFCGNSFAVRDVACDKIFPINERLRISGFDEVIFSSPLGIPDSPFSNADIISGNVRETLTLNAEGAIE